MLHENSMDKKCFFILCIMTYDNFREYFVLLFKMCIRDRKSTISWDPDFSVYTWYAEQDEANNQTIIYANFHEKDPNKENVEISVRRNCFYPESEGIGYITLSGFRISQAATQWAPPTAYQEGMVGPHWSKGWILSLIHI